MKKNQAEINQISSDIMKRNILDLMNVPGVKDRDIRILRLRYGLDDGRIRTLQEVAEEVGLTRERVRQIEQKALKDIRLAHSRAAFNKSSVLL